MLWKILIKIIIYICKSKTPTLNMCILPWISKYRLKAHPHLLFSNILLNYYVYSKGSIIDESKYLNFTSNDDTHSIPPPEKKIPHFQKIEITFDVEYSKLLIVIIQISVFALNFEEFNHFELRKDTNIMKPHFRGQMWVKRFHLIVAYTCKRMEVNSHYYFFFYCPKNLRKHEIR